MLARLCVDGEAYTALVAEADRGDACWREIAETLLTLYTNALVARWASDFDGLVVHAELILAHALDAAARDRGLWAPGL